MRIPHYLYLAPSGVWHFRQRLPAHLAKQAGQAAIKRSLGTRDLLTAQRCALELAHRYAEAFAVSRGWGVSRDDKPTLDASIQALKKRRVYEIEFPNGAKLKTDGSQAEHDRAMQALTEIERIGLLSKEPYVQQQRAQAVASPTSSSSFVSATPIGKAVTQWLAEIKPTTKPKTLTIKAAAVESFAKLYGVRKPLSEAGRIDVGQWVQALRASGLETPTIVNKCSYLRGFFDWAKARGYYPHFAKDENPAAGQIVYRTREKRARRALGFKAFTQTEVRALFSGQALESLSEAARWGALIGLFTGARVAEVGQVALKDFVDIDGVPCIRITDEGTGQSVKTETSNRTIPLHPALIALGLLERVNALRNANEKRLFPKVKMDGVNGAGNWLSKAFSRHISANVTPPEKGRHGFHSLRKTAIQELQTLGVSSEIRAAYVGHELDDEHHASYSRAPTAIELLEAVSKLDWKLDLKSV